MPKPLILVIEDNREVRLSARFVLEDFGFCIAEVENPTQAVSWLQEKKADLLLLDMNFQLDTTSGEEGLAFLTWLERQALDVPVIAMTAWSNTELVVKAMHKGVNNFIDKPWNNQHLHQVIQQLLQIKELGFNNRKMTQRLEDSGCQLIWQSEIMKKLMQQLATVAKSDANILLTGENGTGKSQLARWLHASSLRAKQPFVSLNMGAIPDSLFESEMFGHKRGAFTDAKEQRIGRFELAHTGTLFLDEIAAIPLSQQSKLLRVLESGEFEKIGSSQTCRADVRIISASNCDFQMMISSGAFRQDLFYRLNTLEFRIPALRERQEDIATLAQHFIKRHGLRYRKPGLSLSACAAKSLQAYSWPGNIRELSHVIERAVLLADQHELTAAEFNFQHDAVSAGSNRLPMITLEEAELQLVQQALAESMGSKQRAADLLGITKSSLYRRLEKYDLAT